DVKWGDGTGATGQQIYSNNMPAATFMHKYAKPGKYPMDVRAVAGCTGGARMEVSVDAVREVAPVAPPVASTTPPAVNKNPVLGTLTGLILDANGTVATTPIVSRADTLRITAVGSTGLPCGIRIDTLASAAPPAVVVVDSSNPFNIVRQLTPLISGNHKVNVSPIAIGAVPACLGAPISANVTVL
ncbi:MAG: hypothetical protein ABI583_07865, partial [Betaproteobacteria bacterium]